jgi:Protein of unknown function (DUF3105)
MVRVAFLLAALSVIACSDTDHSAGDPDAGTPEDGADAAPDEGDAAPDESDAAPDESEDDGSVSQDAGSGGLCSACGSCEETLEIRSAQHKPEPISYSDNPPAGGDHAACWSTFGVHASAVPEARWVHNLEHGAVVFLHNCKDGCAAELKELEAIAKGRPFALVTPDARLPKRFAVVAWGVRLVSDCLDRDVFERFYEKHVDQAGESSSSGPPGGC